MDLTRRDLGKLALAAIPAARLLACVAGTSESPIPLIQKHHSRIASIHLKDRMKASNGGANLPWGQGETPIKEILQSMRKEKYQFPASIELEYQIPEGSDAVVETSKCVQFSKYALA